MSSEMEKFVKLDSMLRKIKKDDPTQFKTIEDLVDMTCATPLPRLRNIFKPYLNSFFPLDRLPMTLVHEDEELIAAPYDIAIWMTATRAGSLGFGVIKHALLSKGIDLMR